MPKKQCALNNDVHLITQLYGMTLLIIGTVLKYELAMVAELQIYSVC